MRDQEFLTAAKEYSRVTIIDEEKQRHFLAGVKWLANRIARQVAPSPYENMTGYPKSMIQEMDAKSVKSLIVEALELE